MEKNKNSGSLLAKRMAVSLVCGLAAGFAFMMLREKLVASGNSGIWQTINDLLFQDITTEGAERALGLFYIIGQLFIKALQLVIIPMVFTSIALAIGSIADTRTMGRISAKTLFWFLLCSFMALALAGCVGYATYSMGLFNTHIEGLTEAAGSTGSNPLNVVLNVIPSNIVTAFGSNNAVLSSVFLAVAVGLSMNVLGESRTATLRRLLGEVNDVVVVFLNFVVTTFAPFAVFVLLTRTFAIYGIDYLKPALVYVVVTVALLLVFLLVAYPLVVALGAKQNPITFIKKIANVAVFGFSTSSSAATLPLNIKVCTEDFGVDESIASFVLPLGMTINMDGTAIMQVVATVFIAGCARPAGCGGPAGSAGLGGHPCRPRRRGRHPLYHPVRRGLRQRQRPAGLLPHPCHQPPHRDARHLPERGGRRSRQHLCGQERGPAERGKVQRIIDP